VANGIGLEVADGATAEGDAAVAAGATAATSTAGGAKDGASVVACEAVTSVADGPFCTTE
jgi:hypothetical protein